MKGLATTFVACSLLLACAAEAQQRRVHAYDFDDSVVDGDLVRPDVELVRPRPAPAATPSDPEAAIEMLSRRAERGEATDAERLRLAELLADRATRRFEQAYRAMDAAFAAHQRGDAAEREREGSVRDEELSSARRDEERAIEHLRSVSRQAERRLRARALSLESYLLVSLEHEEQATDAAEKVLRICPSCDEAADAHLRIAEHAFVEANMQLAIEHYRRVLDVPGASADQRAYARYKCGWALFNLGRFGEAWTEIDAARREASEQGEASRTLVREAKRDLVLVLSRLRVDAHEAMQRIDDLAADRVERSSMTDRYEQLLRDQGRTHDADAFAAARRAAGGAR